MAVHDLRLSAIENFDPVHWHDVLLAGPKPDEQIAHLQQIVMDAGRAGIQTIGYNFSLAGVAGRIPGSFARGGAVSVGMNGVDETPIPDGMVWNMVWDRDRVVSGTGGTLPEISHDELWNRLEYFLTRMIPVAEEAGVRLALHPDDPPVSRVRRQPRLVWTHDLYQKALDLVPSDANALEFCLGTLMEMSDGDIYETIRRYVGQNRVAYIHFRNVVGKAPEYREVFIDEGDLDMHRVMTILHELEFDGVLIPDHTPHVTCGAPRHAGMAYAMGYMMALHRSVRGV